MDVLTPDKIALIEGFHLASGAHDSFSEGACALELVSYIAGEPWSDHPKCVCPVLGAFFRAWNDGLPDDERDILLKPFLPRLIGTKGSAELAERRSLMAADWLVRVHTPAWLRLAKLDAQADALAGLPEITAMAQIPSIRAPIEAAQRDARAAGDAAGAGAGDAAGAAAWAAAWAGAGDAAGAAAWAAARAAAGAGAGDAAWAAAWAGAGDAAWAAAWAAARAGAWAAAWAAAWDAAGDAARAGAWAGAWAAAWDAAGAAARAALKPTRLTLLASAAELVERMLSVRE